MAGDNHNPIDKYYDDSDNLRYGVLAIIAAIDIAAIMLIGINAIFYPLGFSILMFWLKPWRYAVKTVTPGSDRIEILKSNFFAGTKTYEFDIHKVDFIYRDRPIKFERSGFPFSKDTNRGNVLTIFFEEHPLVDLTPDEDGWSDTTIMKLAVDLKSLEVPQVVEKFGDKDVLL